MSGTRKVNTQHGQVPDPAPAKPDVPEAEAEVEALDVGVRLKALRRLYGVSQRELARRSGVTNGTISLIEQNRVSPTIASLKKVISGFPLSLSEFFGEGIGDAPRSFYRASELTRIRVGDLLFRQVGPFSDERKIQLLHERYEPGADTGESMLVHDGEEAGIVVRGEVEVTVGGRVTILGPGDGYYFQSRLPHRFRNLSDEASEIVSACTPPSF